ARAMTRTSTACLLARRVLLAAPEEISRVGDLVGADHVAHRIFTIGDGRAELGQEVAGRAAHLDGDQGVEGSVAEEDAKPFPLPFAPRRHGGEGEDGAREAGALESRGKGHPTALAEAAEDGIRAFPRDLLDGLERNLAGHEDFATVEGDALRSLLQPAPGLPALL